jgi:phosphonate transport system ATP-binding protein
MLSINGLSKTFPDGTRALENVSVSVNKGEFVVILGPSGSGKTTLLRSINGLIEPSGGEIALAGQRVRKENLRDVRRNVGMIFQDFGLVPNLSAINNVLAGQLDISPTLPSLFYLFDKKVKLEALSCLDSVGLLDKAYTRVDQLSGGQQQRVGIARAIIKNPMLLLADEPIASLDPMIAFNILSLLKDINRTRGITVLCNLHQVDFALRFADRLIGLSGGRIVMNSPVSSVTQEYIQDVYKDHDQGMFFGPDSSRIEPDTNLRFNA